MIITSKDNSQIKYIRSLLQNKEIEKNGEFIVEGIKLTKEALEYANVSKIVFCEELLSYNNFQIKDLSIDTNNIELIEVSQNVFNSISDTQTPQGILAVVKIENKLPQASNNLQNIIFALDDIQDPGNLGTIIRTLDAAGYGSLILSSKCAYEYSGKVVRSTMGGIFRLNIIRIKEELSDYLSSLKRDGFKIVTSSLEDSVSIFDFDYNDKIVFVIGNESKGVSKDVFDISDFKVKIPMLGKTESLNAAVATSIIAYEGVRRIIK